MEDVSSEARLTSAAAFVEGGIQDACDDACSICLEAFCESDPSTVTGCKHEFHLQCILEWCQRSSQCPMCWQPISLKDPASQELLEAVERERSFRFNPSRNATIFRHPTLGDFELQHLPVGVNEAELEERIIQHLAAAAAMGRARHISRREALRNRSSAQGRQPQFLVFSHSNEPSSTDPVSSLSPTQSEGEPAPATIVGTPSSPARTIGGESSASITPLPSVVLDQQSASASGDSALSVNDQGNSSNTRRSPSLSSPNSQDRARPSDVQSFSESLKSRFNAVSTRYKESISRSTRGWKERFFSRNTSMADIGSEVRREVNAGIATVSRMMERIDTQDNRNSSNSITSSSENSSNPEPNNHETSTATVSSSSDNSSNPELNHHQISDTGGEAPLMGTSVQASCATSSSSK
ncbi:E3 ubiquitin-protein ligase RHF2A [Hibiscus syriacus]|uniref:RING-type E3 ubiquitin transferase n=1 Tax=Hibiscus syriacus TaxID=106335 RepID=A0A6A2XJP4_HIBSY|nr:E3 ubiquitin-protein ligase RHF2A-like [Hibiscus syriacus]KAE8676431.1 E3 ubiquitin-protein ligase RHF2A [Hibiscus syriacus]